MWADRTNRKTLKAEFPNTAAGAQNWLTTDFKLPQLTFVKLCKDLKKILLN